jgi:gentisate 1,2-dioxygenase
METQAGKASTKTITQFDEELGALSIEGYWKTIGVMPSEPTPRGEPYLWHWKDVEPRLHEATRLINLEEGAERRSLRLCTPGAAWKATSDTVHAAIQMVLPGEVAKAHRHSAAAFRFVIDGRGGYTTVNGERYMMEASDLILTPQTTWHDHGNVGDVPIVWLDVLDFPFVRGLNAIFSESYNDRSQSVVKPDGFGRRMGGPARPAGMRSPRTGAPYHYKGKENLAVLREMGDDEADAFDGVTLDYVNPFDGGPTLPTLQCRLHRLPTRQTLRRHRHTWTTIFHIVSGHGETMAGDKKLSWGPHDTFSMPAWVWHQHRALDGDAVMFSVTDEPILRAFALDRSEAAGG